MCWRIRVRWRVGRQHRRDLLGPRWRVFLAPRNHQCSNSREQGCQRNTDRPQVIVDLVGERWLQWRWFLDQRYRLGFRHRRLRCRRRCAGGHVIGFGRRWRALVGHCLVFHGHQLFQVADVFFQFLDARGRFFHLLGLGDFLFLAGHRALACRLGGRFGFRQFQLVLRFADRRRFFLDAGGADLAARALRGLRRTRRPAACYLAGQLVAVGFEVQRMRRHHALGFGAVQRAHGLAGRHGQDASGLHAVHVLALEGVRIGAIQRHQHHVERHAGRPEFTGDAAQRVALPDAVVAGFFLLARGGRHGGRRRRGRCRAAANTLARLHRRRHLRAARLARFGRIEHERILSGLRAALAAQFQQQVDQRFGQRLRRADADERGAGARLDGKRQVVQCRIEVDHRLAVGIGRRQLGQQGRGLAWLDAGQLHFRAQRLADGGQYRNLAQLGRVCRR